MNNNSNIFYIMVAIATLVLVGLTTPAKCQEAKLVEDVCLGCICEAASGCNLTRSCTTDICGPFRITWFYWADAGQRTVNGEAVDSPTAFENCVLNPTCASQTVQNYMQTFQQDCNGDGKIDCYDYAAIHQLGGYGCPGRISGAYAKRLNQCLAAYGTYDTERPEEPTTQATPSSSSRPDDIISEEPPQTTETVQLQENVTEISQITQGEDIAINFDYKMTVPSISVLEIIRAREEETTTPTSTLEISKVDANKSVTPENKLDTENTAISAKSGNESISSIADRNGSDGTQLKIPPKESTQDRYSNKLELLEKSKNDYMAKQLSLQERLLKAFVDKNRIEEERNELLKVIAKNNKPIGTFDIRAIEDNQLRYFDILERIRKSQNDHRNKVLKFQQTLFEAFLK